MEESKAKIKTQFKLLDLAERETEKIIAKNRTSIIERLLNHEVRELETIQAMKYELQESSAHLEGKSRGSRLLPFFDTVEIVPSYS